MEHSPRSTNPNIEFSKLIFQYRDEPPVVDIDEQSNEIPPEDTES